jgi:hypothetical protein
MLTQLTWPTIKSNQSPESITLQLTRTSDHLSLTSSPDPAVPPAEMDMEWSKDHVIQLREAFLTQINIQS